MIIWFLNVQVNTELLISCFSLQTWHSMMKRLKSHMTLRSSTCQECSMMTWQCLYSILVLYADDLYVNVSISHRRLCGCTHTAHNEKCTFNKQLCVDGFRFKLKFEFQNMSLLVPDYLLRNPLSIVQCFECFNPRQIIKCFIVLLQGNSQTIISNQLPTCT